MKSAIIWLAFLALAGCAAPSGTRLCVCEQQQAAPRYESQAAFDHAEGSTAFVSLVEVEEP